ncbi:hypothetical protein O181_130790 [Austropuccinia psidii MF-1]|uniref:Uncharacterized protein n=1 Tax=Austropuccinia psidii MF-1 TaxID=1389203 RepID=A0A9Q3KZP3_9BASI|nr:hypothetical protein [Austropuccinia psidii MF-1]
MHSSNGKLQPIILLDWEEGHLVLPFVQKSGPTPKEIAAVKSAQGKEYSTVQVYEDQFQERDNETKTFALDPYDK